MQSALFLYYKNIFGNCVDSEYRDLVSIDPPKEQTFGDFSTSISMALSKRLGRKSMDIAEDICAQLRDNDSFERLEVRKPGFINWFIPQHVLVKYFPQILDDNFGKIDIGEGRSVNIEYVSANPTGPIHAGHVRGAVSGDVLARLLSYVGYRVTKEFYVNDAGKQIEIMACSLYHRYLELFGRSSGELPSWGYPGDYLIEIARKIAEKHGDKFVDKEQSEWLNFFREFAVACIMIDIKKDLADLDVYHDVFSSELELLKNGAVDRVVNLLNDKGLIYNGILQRPRGMDSEEWEKREQPLFKSTAYGDDLDRPLQKSDGSWTYLASDLAYHRDKIERGFDEIIDFWGADHGGYIKRMQAGVSAISSGKKNLKVKIVQLVRLLKDGREIKMSKRSGNYITARDVIDKVGKDAIRFMMLTRRDDASLDFDFTKVVEQSRDNPVFYVQYAYARTHSVIKLFKETFGCEKMPSLGEVDLNLLDMDSDMKLVKVLADWPRQVVMAAKNYESHRIVFFLIDLASAFHFLWNQGKENSYLRFIMPNDLAKTKARMVLLKAVQRVIEFAFDIIGITPVEELH
ncbi:MAG: arginine--tRNA ligase [Holosporaceae bacterium]|jgi:arginyl-tRNA synthetase|nr:arginine--tRNA ligase [Holosporaceae bacterium]